MSKLEFKDIEAACKRIRPYVYETPLEQSIYLSNEKKNVFMKLECSQPVKSFKIRGAFNKLLQLSDEERKKGVVAISSGNHGIAVAYAAKKLGLETATIIVPQNTPKSKIEKISYYGGDIILLGNNFDESYSLGKKYIDEHDFTYIDGWDEDEQVYAGQGTTGYEIVKQNPDIDTILVPIGGGGLCTGIAVAAKSINKNIRVIGICSESCMAWIDSVKENKLYNEYESKESICEAMVGGIGHLSYSMREWIDDAICVKEEFVKKAMVHAVLNEKIVTEAAGAVPIAAMLQYGNGITGKNIALVISGGNANNEILLEQIKNYCDGINL